MKIILNSNYDSKSNMCRLSGCHTVDVTSQLQPERSSPFYSAPKWKNESNKANVFAKTCRELANINKARPRSKSSGTEIEMSTFSKYYQYMYEPSSGRIKNNRWSIFLRETVGTRANLVINGENIWGRRQSRSADQTWFLSWATLQWLPPVSTQRTNNQPTSKRLDDLIDVPLKAS